MASSRLWQPRGGGVVEAPLSFPSLVWQTLASRGFHEPDRIQDLLRPSFKQMRSPMTLEGMPRAVDRLVRAFKNQEQVAIYADFDLDGTSGLALLKDGLERLGFVTPVVHQPKRLSEGYGVHVSQIEELNRNGIKLVVTVDVGITGHEALTRAQELGMEVIVTDHHLPSETLPPAYAIVNPNLKTCTSGLGHLSGVGVAFYLVIALRSALSEQGLLKSDFDLKELLDCFVIGTLTDMVPVLHENRVLVKHGLLQLSRTKRPGLRVLLEKLDLWGRDLNAQDVAIRFAPKLNALSRLETGLRPIDLFLVDNMDEAEKMAKEVIGLNQKRVSLQKSGEDLALAMARESSGHNVAWVWSETFHRGVVGLIASRLAETLSVPAFVGSLGEGGRIVGSARVPAGTSYHLVQAMDSARSVLSRFGGHAQAAGFELHVDRVQEFGDALRQYFAHVPLSGEPQPLIYDAEGEVEEINASLMNWLDGLGPFGSQFEPPKFRIMGARLLSAKELKGGHWRFDLGSQRSSHKLSGVWFSPDPWVPVGFLAEQKAPVELIAEPEWNFFRGRKTLQLMVHSLREGPLVVER